jgi:hypothetical protein
MPDSDKLLETAEGAASIQEDELSRDGGQWPEYACTMPVCVDSYENGLAVGRLYSYAIAGAREFRSLDQLLLEVESVLDEIGLAQQWSSPHSILTPTGPEEDQLPPLTLRRPKGRIRELHATSGELATVYLRVYARRHASIQGILSVAGTQVGFRSGVELIHLLREALGDLSKRDLA